MPYVATCTGRVFSPKGYTLFYNYRGYEYPVWYNTAQGYSESPASQHKYEQQRIDEIIKLREEQMNNNKEQFNMEEIFELIDNF